MHRSLIAGALIALAAPAFAGERTATLSVDNMSCGSCPYIVEQALVRVAGVMDATVSFEERTAVVRFGDARTDVHALTRATAEAGFPSRPQE